MHKNKLNSISYSTITKILIVLFVLGRVAGLYLILPVWKEVEMVQENSEYSIAGILAIVFANVSRLATFVVMVFIFMGSKNALVTAWIVFICAVLSSILFNFPRIGYIFYNFEYPYIRQYATMLFSIILLVLIYRDR